MEKEIFSVEETAKILDMHPRTIRRYIKNGILKANKLGGQWKIKKLDLAKLMDTSEFGKDMVNKANNDIENFIKNNSNKLDGKIQVCSIVDYYAETIEEVQPICEALLKIMNTIENNNGKTRFEYTFIPENNKARFILWGTPSFISKMLEVF